MFYLFSLYLKSRESSICLLFSQIPTATEVGADQTQVPGTQSGSLCREMLSSPAARMHITWSWTRNSRGRPQTRHSGVRCQGSKWCLNCSAPSCPHLTTIPLNTKQSRKHEVWKWVDSICPSWLIKIGKLLEVRFLIVKLRKVLETHFI